jgi:lipoprotein-anchoring transpeptidase ErfK/SrfK
MNKLLLASLLVFSTPVLADFQIDVNKKTQTMRVYEDDELLYTWKVSTARKGYVTPVGTYAPYFYDRMHYSKKYDNAPMPNSIFYSGGFAIHATPYVGNLGHPASHGCVRLSPTNAQILFDMTKGVPTTISISE